MTKLIGDGIIDIVVYYAVMTSNAVCGGQILWMEVQKMNSNTSLLDMLKICLKRWYLMVIFSLLFAFGMYFYSAYIQTPMYKSTGQLYVTNSNIAVEDTTKISASDLSSGERLCNTLVELMKNDAFLEKVKNMGGIEKSTSAIRGMLVFDQPDETTLINIRVNNKSPEFACELATEVLKHAPKYLENEITGTSVKVIQLPRVESTPYSPNVGKSTVIGFIIGFVIGVALALCLEFLSTKIEDSEGIEEAFGYPVLGEIPNLKAGLGGAYGRYGGYGKGIY